MVTNFDYLKKEPKFSGFANVAISAERIILMDPEASIINSRRAMEFAIKWMYSVDSALEMPYQDNLYSLMNTDEYRQIVGSDILRRMEYIRRCGNNVAHGTKKLGRDEAMLCLENLFIFIDFMACCYSAGYEEHTFDKNLINARIEKVKNSKAATDTINEELAKVQEKTAQQEVDLKKLIEENASLKEELSARRREQQQTYVPKPLDLSEYKTRKLYIDAMLVDAGWTEGKDWLNEVELDGMPNKSETGYADYVFYDDMHRPLAVIEANFTDELLSTEWKESELENDELKNYKAKAEYYIRQHQDNIVIAKLRSNKPLTSDDVKALENILWEEVGTKTDYEHEVGTKPLGEFVREIVGLDMNAAKEAFSEYLTNTNLDSRQIYFVNQIVEYIVHNGMMKDFSVLQESPFTDYGSIVDIFTDMTVWMGIKKVIDTINANAAA